MVWQELSGGWVYLPSKKINDFVINSLNTNHVGKIIIENDKFFTIQKGRPYFFPKCKITELNKQSKLQYKIIKLFIIVNQSHLGYVKSRQ